MVIKCSCIAVNLLIRDVHNSSRLGSPGLSPHRFTPSTLKPSGGFRSSSQPAACTHLGSLANVSTGQRVDSANLYPLRKVFVYNAFTCYSSIVEYWLDIYIHYSSTARVSGSPKNPHLKGSSHNSKVFHFLIRPSLIP